MAPAQVSKRDYAERGVRDEDLPTIVARSDLHEGLTSLDFSRNRLTATGLECLLNACSFRSLRVVKLYKNSLADDAAVSLTALCHNSPGLMEMHLSHNSFTSTGAKAIVNAALAAEKLQGLPPLWLRLERNRVEDPTKLLEGWTRQNWPICSVTDSCRRPSCSLGMRVHLPHFTAQEWCAPEVPMQRVGKWFSTSEPKRLRHLKRRPPDSWIKLRCVPKTSWKCSDSEDPPSSQEDQRPRCFMASRSQQCMPSERLGAWEEPVKSRAARWLSCSSRSTNMMHSDQEEGAEGDDRVEEIEIPRAQPKEASAIEEAVGRCDSDAESTEDPDAHRDDENKAAEWLRMDDDTRAQIMNMADKPEIDFDSEESEWDEPAQISDTEGVDLEEEDKQGDEIIADQSIVAAAMDAQEPRVVYTGSGFFVLFKPPKCVCEPPNTTIGVARYVHQMGIEDTDAAICHRLDLPTSGLLLVGSDPDVLDNLLRQRNARSWCKNYVCLMHGWLPPSQVEGTLQSKLRTEREGQGYRTFVDNKWGFTAITHYAALRHYKCRMSGRPFTLMMLRIITGRTHQIRVHIAELGMTAGLKTAGIAGDAKYLDSAALGADVALFQRASQTLTKVIEPRLCLHACSLGFRTPQSKAYITVKCGLPSDLAAVINHELIEERSLTNAQGSLAESGSWLLRELKAAASQAQTGGARRQQLLHLAFDVWAKRAEDSDSASEALDRWRDLSSQLLIKDSQAASEQLERMKQESQRLSHLAGTWRDSYGIVGRFHADSLVMAEDGETSAVKVQITDEKASILVLLYGDFWQANLHDGSLSWSTGEVWKREPR